MSGIGHPRHFDTHHRPDEVRRLAQRFLHGAQNERVKPADYDKMEIMILEKKMAASQSMLKYKKLKEASKQNRTQGMLHQHRAVWLNAAREMSSDRAKAERDVAQFVKRACADESESKPVFDTMETGISHLNEELKEFRSRTVSPLWSLRQEAITWMERTASFAAQGVEEIRPDKLDTLKEEDEDSEETEEEKLRSLFSSASNKIREISQVLEREEKSLTMAIQNQNQELDEVFRDEEILDHEIAFGAPPEVDLLHCPFDDLRADAKEEFHYLDEIFVTKLHQHDSLYCDVRWSSAGDWSENDHVTFLLILAQYPPGVHDNNWALCMDRLAKTFPQRSRQQIVEHQSWCRRLNHYRDMKESIYNDWRRHKKELMDQVRFAFDDASQEAEAEKTASEGRENQERKCAALLEQVQLWREKKMEAWILEQELQEEMRKHREEEMKKEDMKRRKKEEEKKQMIKTFQSEKQRKRKIWIKQTKKRLQILEDELAAQSEENEKRVYFRAEKRAEKAAAEKRKSEAAEAERRRREEALEALRATVAVEAEADPLRLLQDTAATRERFGRNLDSKDKEDDYETAMSTLHNHLAGPRVGFTNAQILADQRVRAEMLLRDAGAPFGEYTRHALKALKPATEPRRDLLVSDVFKLDGPS